MTLPHAINALNGATQDMKQHNDTMDVIQAAREAFKRNKHLIPNEADETTIRMIWQLAFTEGTLYGADQWSESLERLAKAKAWERVS